MEQNLPAVGAPVEPTVRRPLGMPDYTPEQKAAAIRMMMRLGTGPLAGRDLSALRFMASVGEPLNPEAVVWGRPLGMPDYTPEQKAAAFDALWETCGLGHGMLRDWVDRPVSRAAKEATFHRVPRYTFEILAEGEGMQRFRDVLHHLATRKGA